MKANPQNLREGIESLEWLLWKVSGLPLRDKDDLIAMVQYPELRGLFGAIQERIADCRDRLDQLEEEA